MLTDDLIRLVKTMSSAEKRHFTIAAKNRSGEMAYLSLFRIIDQTPFTDTGKLEKKYKEAHPGTSFETASRYLLKIVVDVLADTGNGNDIMLRQMRAFARAKVLFDRSLIIEGFKELKNAQQLALLSQNYLMQYAAYRQELDILSGLSFPDVTENTIIELQMKGKSALKMLSQIHEHYSLFELLKLRLIDRGKTISEQAKQNMNDLLLSELSLITNKVSYNFESKKLHLLFQSFYFTSTGDYRSALKTFSELNDLFESNDKTVDIKPADYLSSLEGILDSLRTIRAYDEMDFYIDKVNGLINPKYTEQFNHRAAKTISTYKLNLLTGKGKFAAALDLVNKQDDLLLRETVISDYEKHCELLFYIGLTYFGLNDWEKALRYVNKIANLGEANHHFIIYKAAKLLGILSRYELGDMDYLQYEIRAFKRPARSKGENLLIDKLVLKLVILDPNNNSAVKNKLELNKLKTVIDKINHDKYELQVLKFFDFTGWIIKKLNAHPPKSRVRKSRDL